MRSEIIYSAQKRGFIKGQRYANARYFSGPARDVTSVIIVGKWQNIIDAYRMQAADVTVTVVADVKELEAMFARRAAGKAGLTFADQSTGAARTKRKTSGPGVVAEITLPAPEEVTTLAFPVLRQLAAQLSTDEIGSRQQAEAIIEAERARRGAA